MVGETFRRKTVDFAIHFPNQIIHVYRVNFRKKSMRFFPLFFFFLILDGYIFFKRIKRRVVFNVVIPQKILIFFFFHTSAHILFLPLSI